MEFYLLFLQFFLKNFYFSKPFRKNLGIELISSMYTDCNG